MAKAAKKACGSKAKARYRRGGLVDDGLGSFATVSENDAGPLVDTQVGDLASRVDQYRHDQRWSQGHTLTGTQQDRALEDRTVLEGELQALRTGLGQQQAAAQPQRQPVAPPPPVAPAEPSQPYGQYGKIARSGMQDEELPGFGQTARPFGLRRGGAVRDYARGGKVPRGKKGRDTIPAKIKGGPRVQLDNGEYAVPDEATRKIGKRNLDATVLALTGEPPVGYEPGGRVALVPPEGYATGGWLGRLTGRFDRTAQLDAAEAAASGQTQQAPTQAQVSPPQEAQSPGTSMADVMREIRAKHPAQQGYAQGGQVTYGPWGPVQGGLDDYVQRGRQRAVYGATGPDVAPVGDAQMAARSVPNTREPPGAGTSNTPDPRRMLPPEAWLQATASTDAAGGSSLPVEASPQNPRFPRGLGVLGFGADRPPVDAAKVQRWREQPGFGSAIAPAATAVSTTDPARRWGDNPDAGMPAAPSVGLRDSAAGQFVGRVARAMYPSAFARQPVAGDRQMGAEQTAARGQGLLAVPAAAEAQETRDFPVSKPAGPGPASNVRQMRPASSVGLDARTMSGVAQHIADRAASGAVAGPNDYITPMDVGAGGKPIYRNLVAPDGQAEYGKAIYGDTVPGATRAGLDQDIRKRGTAVSGGDPVTQAAAQQAQARLDLAKRWYGMKPSERGWMPDKVADTLGEPRQPRPGQAQPSIEERKLGLDYAKAGAEQTDKRQQRAHEAGIKQMELEAGYSKEQRAAATQWDNDLRHAMTGLAKQQGDGLGGAAGAGLSPKGQAWALRAGAMLRRSLPGLDANQAAGSLYGAAVRVLDQPQALAAAMQQLQVKEPTPEVKALAEQMMRESEQQAQDELVRQVFGG